MSAELLDWLERRAHEIADLHVEALKYAERGFSNLVSSLECQALAGAKLAECKARLKHGQWLPWLEKYPRIHPRRAQRYIWLSKHWDVIATKLEAIRNATAMSHLDRLGAAREFLSALHIAEQLEAGERPKAIVATFDYVHAWATRITKRLLAAPIDPATWSTEQREKTREALRPAVELYERCQ